ncbi:MAG: heavy metal translocating P-type ATPase [Caloramator sp.]|nr:heavy metal translocating P-type ATPase [Caloramator sp.]
MKKEYILYGLGCANCASKMEVKIRQLNGVKDASIDFVNKTLMIDIDGDNHEIIFDEIERIILSIEPDIIIKEKTIKKMLNKTLILVGLNCANCAAKIEKDIKNIYGVKDASINLTSQKLVLTIDDEKNWEDILAQVKFIVNKYEPDVKVEDKEIKAKLNINSEIIYLVSGAVLFLLGYLFKNTLRELLFILSYVLIGHDILLKAFKNIKNGQVFDENFLMSIATIGAFLIGEMPEAVSVMLFYKIGETLQDLAIERSRRSIKSLLDIRPDFANLVVGHEIKRVDPDDVKIGDFIIVKPGERIPLDGVVVKGNSSVDTSALTGETILRDVSEGDEVLGGFINKSGLLKIKVTKEFKASTVNKILELVEGANRRKAKTENFITKFARVYTPIVVLAALLIAVIPPMILKEPFSSWVYRALIFLVVSCPCALVISIPLGFFGGIGAASKNGILVKGSNYLEALNYVNMVVFDKTGTLTKGKLRIKNIRAEGVIDKRKVLEYAAYAEFYSNHPIAQCILKEYGVIDKTRIKEHKEISGFGIEAKIDDKEVLVGSAKLMIDRGISIREDYEVGTKVYVAVDGKFIGCIVIEDEIKEDAKETILLLKKMGIKPIMLTGDHRDVASDVAEKLDIDEYYYGLLPDEKVEKLEELEIEGENGKIVFVGDGINDAPVIARADIGIAMGALGQDAAIEAADIVIMNDQIKNILTAMNIAKKTKKVVWQNICLALFVKVLVMVMASFGVANMWEAVFADVGVALLAVLNSIRIIRG